MKTIDVRDLACPGPVLKLRELLDEGEREITMHVADELCRSNVTRFAGSRNARSRSRIPATEHSWSGSSPATNPPKPGGRRGVDGERGPGRPQGQTAVVQITATTMGSGDDELGALLLRSFLKTQAELERKPDAILFYNDGVKLCCEGSYLLDDLRGLEAAGVEIIACGTCLNFFELGEQLRVGRVTDMLEIAGRLADAGSIVRP